MSNKRKPSLRVLDDTPNSRQPKKMISFSQSSADNTSRVSDDIHDPLDASLGQQSLNKTILPSYMAKTPFGICYVPTQFEHNAASTLMTGKLKNHQSFLRHTSKKREAVVMVLDEVFMAKGIIQELQEIEDSSLKVNWIPADEPTDNQLKQVEFFLFLLHLDNHSSFRKVQERLNRVEACTGSLNANAIVLFISSEFGRSEEVVLLPAMHNLLAERQKLYSYRYSKVNREKKNHVLKSIYEDIKEYKGITGTTGSSVLKWSLRCPFQKEYL